MGTSSKAFVFGLHFFGWLPVTELLSERSGTQVTWVTPAGGAGNLVGEDGQGLGFAVSLGEPSWLNLQSRYDIEVQKDKMNGRIEVEVRVHEGD